jgi:hypothetical protein
MLSNVPPAVGPDSGEIDVMVGVETGGAHLVIPTAHEFKYKLKLARDALTQLKFGGPAPSNACEPILVNVSGSVSEVIPIEPRNAPLPIDVTFAGIFTTCNEPLPANALLGMAVIPLPKVTVVSRLMSDAKLAPRVVTEFGIFNVVSAVPLNAISPIDVTRFGIAPILASCGLPKNRANGISVIVEGSTTDVKSGHA